MARESKVCLLLFCFIMYLLTSTTTTTFDDDTIIEESFEKESFHQSSQMTNHCFKDKRKSLTLVSTLDGKFFALDSHSGKVIWSLERSGPLLSSSLSSIKREEDLAKLKFVPSLDGRLFKMLRDKIEAVPFSADMLLGGFQKLPDGTHIVGGKDIKSFGIDAETGNLIYECTMNGCKPISKEWNLSERDVFILRRTQQIIRAVDKTGEEKWNFSVGSYDVNYMSSPDHHNSNCGAYSNTGNLEMRFHIAHGYVEAVQQNNKDNVRWSFKFDSPIASVWKFDKNIVQPVDVFRHGLLKDMSDEELPVEPILYLGIHAGQMYAQSSKIVPANALPDRPGSTQPNESQELAVVDQPYIGAWRPYISSSPSRTPSLTNKNDLQIWNQLDYPFDNGFCMIALKRISTLKKLGKSKDLPTPTNKSFEKNLPDYQVIPVSLVERWKEILALAVFISVFLQFTIFKFIKRRWKRFYGKMNDEHEDVIENEFKRARSVTSTVATSTELSQPLEEKVPQRSESTQGFLSRYLLDFDHLECIGKGGFGVVFKARNKIDGCDYAVKRIYLPNCVEARQKVTREVKALAKLDYPGIVRFYYSWWEAPPSGWQETKDRDHLIQDECKPIITNLGFSKEWYIHIQSDTEDTFDEGENSEESGITIRRKRNRSSMSSRSKRSSKSIGDDPLGRRINDFSDIEDDLQNTDLLKHNEVFHDEICDEDSFNIEFKNESCSEKEPSEVELSEKESNDPDFENNGTKNSLFVGRGTSKSKNIISNTSSCNKSVSDNFEKGTIPNGRVLQSRMSTKLVGRCCCKSKECLESPPLYLYIQMQLCMSSTLKDWLNENITSRQRRFIVGMFNQILSAVEYCHGQGMMHRDLKPSNIFFAMDGSIKVGDFGLVTAITRPSEGKGAGQPAIDENHTGNVGTQIYMSPEQVYGDSYNHKVDIYALGLILFELLWPFSTQMERIKSIFGVKQNKLPDGFEEKHPRESKVLRWLLNEDPEERPEATNFRSSELFTKTFDENQFYKL